MFNLPNMGWMPKEGPDIVYIYGAEGCGKTALCASITGQKTAVCNPDGNLIQRFIEQDQKVDVLQAAGIEAFLDSVGGLFGNYDSIVVDDLLSLALEDTSKRMWEYQRWEVKRQIAAALPQLKNSLLWGNTRLVLVDTMVQKKSQAIKAIGANHQAAVRVADYIFFLERHDTEGRSWTRIKTERSRQTGQGIERWELMEGGYFSFAYSLLDALMFSRKVIVEGSWYRFPERAIQGFDEAMLYVEENLKELGG